MRYLIIVSLLSCSLISGCENNKNSTDLAKLSEKIAQVNELTEKIDRLESRVAKLQVDHFMLKMTGPQESVEFDPQDEKAYLAVRSDVGAILAVLERVEPYLDGFTVSMRMGNPTSASFTGFKAKVQWGRKFDPQKDLDYNNLAEKEMTFTDFLPSGSWRVVKFNIAPAKADQVRRIIFSPTFNTLQLRG